MKKLALTLMALAGLALALSACGKKEADQTADPAAKAAEQAPEALPVTPPVEEKPEPAIAEPPAADPAAAAPTGDPAAAVPMHEGMKKEGEAAAPQGTDDEEEPAGEEQ